MITEIADILARTGMQLTPRELEDILWLASRIDEPLANDPSAAPADTESHDQDIDNLGDEPDEDATQNELGVPGTGPSEPSRAEPALPLYAKGMQGSLAGSTLRIRGLSQSPAPDALRRALQPFFRRVPSRWQIRLDEEATVTRTADTGIRIPVFTPVHERRFDLTLVIEDCTSAELRKDTLRDLSRHFRTHSGLRDVRCYQLRGDTPPRLVALDGEAEYGLEHLKDNNAGDGRHLVLFATDGTSQRWRNGSAQAFLHAVGASTSVSLLHLLPRAAWRRTLIGEPDVTLHCERPGAPNTHFKCLLPWWMDAEEVQRGLPVPVLGLDAASAGTWARAISALGGATMPGVLVNRPPAPIAPTMPASGAAPDPIKLVARYRNIASPSAYRLAVFLSRTNPVTIPIMRLVQRTMLPNSGEGELAEFLLGGLVTRGQSQEEQVERLYYFRDGVAGELLKALRYSEEETIARQLSLVGQALEGNDDEQRNLEVDFPTPDGAASLSKWALPFATVSQRILRGQPQLEAAPANLSTTVDEVAEAATRTTLRILHLSDLHVGGPSSVAGPDRAPPFGPIWQAHLSQLAKDRGVDVVCISGDLTWTAGLDEFAKLDQFLDETLEALSLPKSRLFVVPGNHDMRRDASLRRSENLRLSAGTLGDGPNVPPPSEAAARAQSNYRDWLKRYLPHQYAVTGRQYADFQLDLPGWLVPVRIVGIDSAWMKSIAGDANLSVKQLQAQNVHAAKAVTVAIMHHQSQQLGAPRELTEHLKRARVHLLLHGLEHGAGPKITKSGTTALVSSGVALSPQRNQPIAFHVIELALDAIKSPTLTEIMVHEWHKHASKWVATPSDSWHGANQTQPDPTPSDGELVPRNIFISRGAELERLREVLFPINAHSAPPGRCMITGLPGVGKTTLFKRFAEQYWSPGAADHKGGYVIINTRGDVDFQDQLLKKFKLSSMQALSARLNDQHTLLVIEDVDSPDQMDAAQRLALSFSACPVLLIGRYPMRVATGLTHWDVISLEPLSRAELVRLLRLLLDTIDVAITESDATAIVAALPVTPLLVHLVAGRLTDRASVNRLLFWLGAAHSGELLTPLQVRLAVDDFPWLLPAATPVFEDHWRSQLDEDVLEVLTMLANGPISGFSTSLGLALSGLASRTASAATIRRFTYICGRAVTSGLLRKEKTHWRFAIPAVVAWLRARGTEQNGLAMLRWSDWLAIRMAAPAKSRARPWAELNEIPAGLIEWLDTCPPDAAELVRPVCVPYAIAHGPLDAWQHFCHRILQSYLVRTEWYFTLAELARANGELDAALDAVDHYLALKREVAKPDKRNRNAIDAGINLKIRILAEQRGWSKIPITPRLHVIDTVPEDGRPTVLRPHQQALADAACAATLRAEPGTRCIGLVVQTQGSGAIATLAAYLEACRRSGVLERSNVVVVADSIDIARQLVQALQSRGPEFEVIEPQSVNELAALFRTKRTPIVVTTEHKVRQLQGTYRGERLVVGFTLRRPSRSLIATLPEARMIIFGSESLTFKSSPTRQMGPLIASYRLEDAIRDGYLAPPQIRVSPLRGIFWEGDKADRRAGDLSEAGIKMVATRIHKDWLGREVNSPDKRVIIVKNETDARSLAQTLSTVMTSIDSKIVVLTGRMQSKQAAFDEFSASTHNALLVTTAAMTLGLPLGGIDVCYLAAQLTPTILLKIESLINRPSPDRKIGEILDYASNDWGILGLPI